MRFIFSHFLKSWKRRIKHLGLTQLEFCEQSGISYNTWRHLHNPTIGMMNRIESAITALEEQE